MTQTVSHGHELPRPRAALDIFLPAAVAVVAYTVAHWTLSTNYRVAPAIEDLFVACTRRPGWMVDPSALYALPQWSAFLERRIEYFPCEAVEGMRLFNVGTVWDLQKYFHLTLSTWFRLVGPTINGFITFQSASYAITSVLAYLIFRLGMGRTIALLCVAGFVWSPSHLAIAGLPIEYSKAPWVLGVVLLCSVIVRRDRAGKSLGGVALLLGLVAGVGIGFKSDVIAVVPLAVLTPLMFVRASHRELSRRVTPALLVIAGVAVGGGAMLYDNFFASTGSLLPVQVLGGEDWQTESLHASSPLYDYGVTYDDSYVTWMINSYGHRVLGKTAVSGFYSREMEQVATRLVIDLWKTFPGDLVLRVMAATIRVLELNGFGLSVAVSGLFLVLAQNRRDGWFVVFLTVYLCAYVSLIFQRRHFFHLEVLSWWLSGVVAQALLSLGAAVLRFSIKDDLAHLLHGARTRLLKPALGAALSLLSIAVGASAVLFAARQYQQAQVIRLVDHYRQMPREERGVTASPVDAEHVSLRIDGLSLQDREHDPVPPVSDYLIATFRCRVAGVIPVKSKYLPPVVDWSNWNRDFNLICAAAGGESTLMLPIYQYGTAYRFDKLIVSQSDAAALISVSTMRTDPSVGIWLDLELPGDWRGRKWFEMMSVPPVMPI